jgi:hypothetical protein
VFVGPMWRAVSNEYDGVECAFDPLLTFAFPTGVFPRPVENWRPISKMSRDQVLGKER